MSKEYKIQEFWGLFVICDFASLAIRVLKLAEIGRLCNFMAFLYCRLSLFFGRCIFFTVENSG